MTATPDRIGFVTKPFRAVVSSDEAVKLIYGEAARDTKDEPVETFFDETDDAQVMVQERMKLLKRGRRRFAQDVNQILSFTGDLDFTQQTPAATVIDDERAANITSAIVEVGLRLQDGRTTLVTWGAAAGSDNLLANAEAVLVDGVAVEMI